MRSTRKFYMTCPVCGEPITRKVRDAKAPTAAQRDRALMEEAYKR